MPRILPPYQYEQNPYFLRPGESVPSYNARIAQARTTGTIQPASTSGQAGITQGQSGGVDSFNTALLQLLQKYQQLGTKPFKEQELKAEEAQIGRISAETPSNLIGSSPSVQSSVQGASAGALDPTIQGARSAGQTFSEQLRSFGDILGTTRQLIADNESRQNKDRDDARAVIKDAFTIGGADSINSLSPDETAKLEKAAGYPKGYIQGVSQTLKERELQVRKDIADQNAALRAASSRNSPNRLLSYTELEAYGLPAGSTLEDAVGLHPLSLTARKGLSEIAAAIPLIDTLEREISSIKLPTKIQDTIIQGTKLKAASLLPSTPEGIYNAEVNGFIALITRALGEKGTLATYDVQRIRAAIPGFYDTKESARKKLNNLRGIMQQVYERMQSGYYESSATLGQGIKSTQISSGTTVMTGPDGKRWNVPNDKIEVFKQNGYK